MLTRGRRGPSPHSIAQGGVRPSGKWRRCRPRQAKGSISWREPKRALYVSSAGPSVPATLDGAQAVEPGTPWWKRLKRGGR